MEEKWAKTPRKLVEARYQAFVDGNIDYIYPYLTTKSRTTKIRFEFENKNLELKPDMYANVTINSEIFGESLVVPLSSVLHSGERELVVIDLGEGKFDTREVKLGVETDDYYSVIDGLQEGEKVVISAQFLIDSESRLKESQIKLLSGKK